MRIMFFAILKLNLFSVAIHGHPNPAVYPQCRVEGPQWGS